MVLGDVLHHQDPGAKMSPPHETDSATGVHTCLQVGGVVMRRERGGAGGMRLAVTMREVMGSGTVGAMTDWIGGMIGERVMMGLIKGGMIGMSGGGLMIDLSEEGMIDLIEEGMMIDLIEEGMMIDLIEEGMMIDLIEEEMMIDLIEEGMMIDLIEEGMMIDLIEEGMMIDLIEEGMMIDLIEEGMMIDLIEAGMTTDLSEEGMMIAPTGGRVMIAQEIVGLTEGVVKTEEMMTGTRGEMRTGGVNVVGMTDQERIVTALEEVKTPGRRIEVR